MKNKNSFSLIEIIIVLFILSLFYFFAKPKVFENNLIDAKEKTTFYLNYTKNLSMYYDPFDIDEKSWYKNRWNYKIQNCSSKVGGIYFVIYKDSNMRGYINKEETLKNPLTNKWFYSNYDCITTNDESDDILLTEKFGITNAEFSCNDSSTLAHIIYYEDGNLYTSYPYNIQKQVNKNDCKIIFGKKDNTNIIVEVP